MKISVPLPPAQLSPNRIANQHSAVTARAKKRYWQQLDTVFAAAGFPATIETPVAIDYEFFTARLRLKSGGKSKTIPDGLYRPRDEDNARGSMKAFQDYLKNSGRIRDDNSKLVRRGRDKVWGDKESAGQCGVVVRFRRLGVGR